MHRIDVGFSYWAISSTSAHIFTAEAVAIVFLSAATVCLDGTSFKILYVHVVFQEAMETSYHVTPCLSACALLIIEVRRTGR